MLSLNTGQVYAHKVHHMDYFFLRLGIITSDADSLKKQLIQLLQSVEKMTKGEIKEKACSLEKLCRSNSETANDPQARNV